MRPAIIAALLAVAVCACSSPITEDGRPVVAVSVEPLAFFVEQLAGDAVRVVTVLPPAANPTTFEPTLLQLQALDRAQLYVRVGHPAFPFERAWLDKILDGRANLRSISAAASVEAIPDDPHIWLAVEGMRAFVTPLAAALTNVLPAEAEAVGRRAGALQRRIDELDATLAETLANLPHKQFFVFHPSWGYLARRYGLEQVAVEHGHKEPDAHHLTRTIERAARAGARTIFVQPQFSKRSAEVVAAELDGGTVVLDPMARDWATNLEQVGQQLRQELAR